MDKEGRDIVNSISASARKSKFAQAMENYGTIPIGPIARRASIAA